MRIRAMILLAVFAALVAVGTSVFAQPPWTKTIYVDGVGSSWPSNSTISGTAGTVFSVVDEINPNSILTETWEPGSLDMSYRTYGTALSTTDGDGTVVMTSSSYSGKMVKTYTLLPGCWTRTTVGEYVFSLYLRSRPITVTLQHEGPIWTKTVDGVSWTSGLSREKETADTVPVSDVLNRCGILTETWNPDRLSIDYDLVNANVVDNSSGQFVISTTGVPAYVTKTYTLLPCDWESVAVNEQFQYFNGSSYTTETRPFTLTKDPPVLAIAGQVETQKVLPGSLATFSLTCGNTGGFDNAVSVISYFPAEAPYVSAIPSPTIVTGTEAVEWQFPNGLSAGDPCGFQVTVQILPNTQIGTPIVISNVIVGHTRAVADVYPDPGDPQDDPFVFIAVGEPDPPATVSTLTEWGLLLFALLLAAGSVLVLRRHHKV